jgi:excisionase family DNA binding protein
MGTNPSRQPKGNETENLSPLAGAFFALLDIIVAQSLERLKAQIAPSDDEPALLTRQQAAAYLAVGTSTLDTLRREGKLKPISVGTHPRYSRDELNRYIRREERSG